MAEEYLKNVWLVTRVYKYGMLIMLDATNAVRFFCYRRGCPLTVFITTKLSNRDQIAGNIRLALQNSMKRLGVKSIDLYLIHWPNPETFFDCWGKMEKLYEERMAKAIGVCNFHQLHLERLLKIASIIPAVNQVELHPLLLQKELCEYCVSKSIRVEAYFPPCSYTSKVNKKQSVG
ncbi:MAG: aldo/keto reductase [Candidatus Omnitrophica bacterium]|jgi:diketogulonate reductase-like aldo/keto reductase|nr:aldo/keto reductase [Candidatus Omnitrophota bacterium]